MVSCALALSFLHLNSSVYLTEQHLLKSVFVCISLRDYKDLKIEDLKMLSLMQL